MAAKVQALRGEFVVLDIGSSTGNKEIVNVDKVRLPNRNTSLSPAHFKKIQVPVPDDMHD